MKHYFDNMAMTEKKLMTSTEVQERCSIWVKSQQELLYSKDNVLKRKLENEREEFFDTDSEFDSVSECGAKKRRLAKQMKDEMLNLLCEWRDCLFDSNSMEIFLKHVANHIPQVKIKTINEEEETYVCQWKGCSYESNSSDDIARHVNYHGYHTKLKCIGSNIRGRIKLPKCYQDPGWRNVIEQPSLHMCQWDDCLKIYNNYQVYLYHVSAHIETNPRGNKVDGGVKCKWTGCDGRYASLYKLRDHMRCHTKEKIVACPDCGTPFASNTKFYDHCRRQIPIDMQGFQCSYCNKFYPTEGILRDHMRFHVFNYKCNLCDMSCESPASLAKHIRYRHVTTRPFSCELCTHAAKSPQDLATHMTVHSKGPNFYCNFDGCPYTCKSSYIMERHVERAHGQEIRVYCCHECPMRYRKSYRLTKHLVNAHHFQWPNGHKRFRYKKDEDGFYRLQLVRYESLDDENTMLSAEVEILEKNYNVRLTEGSPLPNFVVSTEDDEKSNPDDPLAIPEPEEFNRVGKSMPIISNILISIDEIDEKGNIVRSKTVETQETNELPPSEGPPIILK